MKGWKLVALLLVTAGAFGTGSWWGCNQGSSSENSASAYLEVVTEVWENLASDHVDSAELDLSLLGQAAIEGMLGALNDPFTTYVTPENYSQRQSSIANSSARRRGSWMGRRFPKMRIFIFLVLLG